MGITRTIEKIATIDDVMILVPQRKITQTVVAIGTINENILVTIVVPIKRIVMAAIKIARNVKRVIRYILLLRVTLVMPNGIDGRNRKHIRNPIDIIEVRKRNSLFIYLFVSDVYFT